MVFGKNGGNCIFGIVRSRYLLFDLIESGLDIFARYVVVGKS